jgi:hypothetical protein
MGNSILQAYRQYLSLSHNTFPSDHSSMSSRGSFARYMFVVFHHSGIPRNMTANWLVQLQKPVLYPECKDDISPCYGLCCGQRRWSHRGRNETSRSVEIKRHEIFIWASHYRYRCPIRNVLRESSVVGGLRPIALMAFGFGKIARLSTRSLIRRKTFVFALIVNFIAKCL